MIMTREEAEFMKLVSQLDEITTEAFIILVTDLTEGGTMKEATQKAADFLLAHPGYERQAESILRTLDEVQAARTILHAE